jgi:hypothetical protein
MGARGIGDQPPDERRGVVVMNRTIGRWRAWTRSHRARYRAGRRPTGTLALTLRRTAAGAVHHQHRHRAVLTWAPRLNLHVRFPVVNRLQVLRGVLRRSETAASKPATPALWRTPVGGPRGGAAQGSETPHNVRITDLRSPLERVFARTARFKTASIGVTRGGIQLPARMTLRAGSRIETGQPGAGRVLHTARHQGPAEPQGGPASRMATSPESPAARRTSDPGLISESSLNSLTERVIRQLDRRIVAYRERLGRPA